MVLDRNAAAIVGHRQKAFGIEIDLDEIGVAGNGFVHRVVDDFGEQVMQRLFVGAADIHARTAPNGFEALQHFDGRGVVIAIVAFQRRCCAQTGLHLRDRRGCGRLRRRWRGRRYGLRWGGQG